MGGSAPPPPPPPPPEGGGTGGGFAPKGIGQILSTAFDLYKNNAAQLLMIAAIVVVPLTLLQALIVSEWLDDFGETFDPQTGDVSSGFFSGLIVIAASAVIGYLIQQLLTGALTRGAAGSLVNRDVDVAASYRYAFSRLGGLIVLSLLFAIIVAIGFALLIIPGIILGVFLSMAIPAFIVERRTASDSLSRSWNLVSGSWWHAFGTIVIAGILAGIVNGIITAIGGDTFIGTWITGAIASILTAPFVALVGIVLYVDLRSRREGLDAATLSRELDSGRA
jgi:hypothetical protein